MPAAPAARRRPGRPSGAAYAGDQALAALLSAAKPALTLGEAQALLAGILAAPPMAAAAWLPLFGDDLSAELQAQVQALAARMAAAPRPPAPHPAVRLAALRRELTHRHLDLYLVSHDDAYLGEYLPAQAERLAWLSDFDGSAGSAVVPASDATKAALFTDGRYQTQARAQVEAGLWEVRHSIDQPVAEWLSETQPRGTRIGYDPWTHSEQWRSALASRAETRGWELVAVDQNLVDLVWTSRPPAPLAPIRLHPLAAAGVTSIDKRAQLAADLARQDVRAAVLVASDSIAWLLNIRGGDVPNTPIVLSYALLHGDGSVDWCVDRRKLPASVAAALDPGIRLHPETAIEPLIRQLAGRAPAVAGGHGLLLDPARTPARLAIAARHAGLRVVEGSDPCVTPKAIKNQAEIAGARRGHRRDAVAMVRFLAWLDREVAANRLPTELQAADQLLALRAKDRAFRGPSFQTISAAGPNAAQPHYHAPADSDVRLQRGQVYLTDSGAQYTDSTTDVTRTVAIGAVPRSVQVHFTHVLRSHLAVARLQFPVGAIGTQLDGVARAPLWAAGLEFDHGTGHGVGSHLSVHEGPCGISRRHTAGFQAGMVVSNEPGYYQPGSHGIRTETLVLTVPARGRHSRPMLAFETLTLVPYDRRLIRTELLSDTDIADVDRYHARVRKTVLPLLRDAQDRDWLLAATAPLLGDGPAAAAVAGRADPATGAAGAAAGNGADTDAVPPAP